MAAIPTTEADNSGKKSTMVGVQQRRATCAVWTTDGWTECFQDLGTWCRQDQDELNTPQLSFQDEFTFSLEGQGNNCVWDLQSSLEQLNDGCGGDWGLCQEQPQLFESPQNMDPLSVADEENNNVGGVGVYAEKPSLLVNNFVNPGVYLGGRGAAPILRNRGNVLLSQYTLGEDMYSREELAPNSGGGHMKNKLNSSMYNNSGNVVVETPTVVEPSVRLKKQQGGVRRVGRPSLKLDMEAAERGAARGGLPTTETACKLNTPEVLTTLTDISDNFNLLKYICEESESSPAAGVAAVVKKEPEEEPTSATQDHDYTSGGSSWSEEGGSVRIKSEPDSSLHHHVYGGEGRSREKRVSETSEEASHNRSDQEGDLDSDGSIWAPGGSGDGPGPSRRRKRRRTSTDTMDSFGSIEDKYRALRDRNNEASRRSRLNRKQRDSEMRKYKNELERKNVELRVKADKMDRLVKEMRQTLMTVVKNSKK